MRYEIPSALAHALAAAQLDNTYVMKPEHGGAMDSMHGWTLITIKLTLHTYMDMHTWMDMV